MVTAGMCRSVEAPASLVVVMGTQYFDSSGLGGDDFPVPELLQMLGLASRPLQDDAGIAVIMCHAAKKEYYKKFLFEPLPVESHLDMHLHDHMVRSPASRRQMLGHLASYARCPLAADSTHTTHL